MDAGDLVGMQVEYQLTMLVAGLRIAEENDYRVNLANFLQIYTGCSVQVKQTEPSK